MLSWHITNQCNYDCVYCNQVKDLKNQDRLRIECFIDSVQCHIERNGSVTFCGGEPLLEIGKIRELVDKIKNRRADIRFSLTTNGSLINDDIETFLKDNFYLLMISYDGVEGQNLRKKGSAPLIKKNIERFVDSKLEFSINSVFTPDTVGNLYSVIEEISELGVNNIKTSLDLTTPWNEDAVKEYRMQLFKLCKSSLREKSSLYRTLRDRKMGYFQCSGCDERLSVGPDGTVVGCFIFQDFVMNNPEYPGIENYIIGNIEDSDLLDKVKAKRRHYERLSQYQCFNGENFCMDCELRNFCAICPVTRVRAGETLTSIPQWICKIKRVEFEIRSRILSGEFS